MTIHFAAAEGTLRPRLSAAEARAAVTRAANDNGADFALDLSASDSESQAILHAALRLFSQHGIGAAAHARGQAERAFFSGDRPNYQWWLSVCRALDRRMAAGLAKEAEREKPANPRETA